LRNRDGKISKFIESYGYVVTDKYFKELSGDILNIAVDDQVIIVKTIALVAQTGFPWCR